MSFQAMAWAIKQRVGHPTRKLILMCIANYVDDKHQCFARQKLIAEEAECSESTVRRSLDNLEADGVIKRIERRRIDGTRTSDLITLEMPFHQPVKLTGSKGINRSSTPDQPVNLTGIYKERPITYPITKENGKNPGRKREPDIPPSAKVARGFQSLSSSLANAKAMPEELRGAIADRTRERQRA